MLRGLLLAAAFLLPALAPAMAQGDTAAPPSRPTAPGTAEQAAPSIDPRIAGPAIEAMQATIKLRDAQLVVVHERVRQLEAELKDAQAKAASPPAAPPAPPKPAK